MKKITKDMVDEATVPTLKEYCYELDIEPKSDDRKPQLLKKLRTAITKRDNAAAAKAEEKKKAEAKPKPPVEDGPSVAAAPTTPPPKPKPAPAAPVDTAVERNRPRPPDQPVRHPKPKPVVQPGSVQPVDQSQYSYLEGGNGWKKELTRAEAVAKVIKLGAVPQLIDRLEKQATTGRPARYRNSVPMRGRLPSSYYLLVSVKAQ